MEADYGYHYQQFSPIEPKQSLLPSVVFYETTGFTYGISVKGHPRL